MALPYPTDDDDQPVPSNHTAPPVPDDPPPSAAAPAPKPAAPARTDLAPLPPRVIRLRIAGWDVIATLLMWAALLWLATMTTWPARLFGFTSEICEEDTCGLVPFGVDFYIRPIAWGGMGAAIAAAVLGPFVSMLKGWYMSFWPVLAVGVLLLSSVAGSILVLFSQRYWH